MKHKTPSPAVLRSCTEAARAAAAHAQESANWADAAANAANASHMNELRAARYAAQAAQTVRRLTIDVILSAFASAIALTVSVFALCHAA